MGGYFAQQAREIAEEVKLEETRLQDERDALKMEMVKIKEGLMEANRHLPGIATATMTRTNEYAAMRGEEAYENEKDNDKREYEVVIFNEPVTGIDGSVTYVTASPIGFIGLKFEGGDDERLSRFRRIMETNALGGYLYSDKDRPSGYSELQNWRRLEVPPVPQIIIGNVSGREDVRFQGDELVKITDESIIRGAFENSKRKAAEKLKKITNPQEQVREIGKQRELGRKMLSIIGEQTPDSSQTPTSES